MGLTSSLQIGRSSLAVSQAGLQVVGNNMANATTPGYTRQTVALQPTQGQRYSSNIFMGRGVELEAILRHADTAVIERIRTALSDEHAANIDQDLLIQLETLQNELSDSDLSTGISNFFNAWTELTNRPEDDAVRSLVIQEGAILAEQIKDLRTDYTRMRDQIDRDIGVRIDRVNEILDSVAELNSSIAYSEQGRGTASSLRDQRDILLGELAQFMDISTVEQTSGTVDVFVGSLPIVLGTTARGIELDERTNGTETEVFLRIVEDGSSLSIASGSIGALFEARTTMIPDVIEDLDEFASSLIFEVNRIHSNGQGTSGFTSVAGTYAVDDTTAALNHADAGLPFEIVNGSFQVHLTHVDSGQRTSYQVDIDLDGIGTDTTLDSLVAQINSTITNGTATASTTVSGELQFDAMAGYEISFSDDSSGALAGLGMNTYFTGHNARDIDVNQTLLDSSDHLASGADHISGSNGTASALQQMQEIGLDTLDGKTLQEFWSDSVARIAVQTSSSITRSDSAILIRESLEAQQSAVSGVSIDEESVNLLQYQQQYQASAKFISVVDEMMQVLLTII